MPKVRIEGELIYLDTPDIDPGESDEDHPDPVTVIEALLPYRYRWQMRDDDATNTIDVPPGALQSRLDVARPGDRLVLVGSHVYDHRLVVRRCPPGSVPVVITSGGNEVVFTGANSGFHVEAGASGYVFDDIDMHATGDNVGLFRFAQQDGTDYQSIEDVPQHFCFRDVVFRGDPARETGYGMLGNCRGLYIQSCLFRDWHRSSGESYGFVANHSPGDITIVDSEFVTAGIPIFFGGASTIAIDGLRPQNIVIDACEVRHEDQPSAPWVYKHLIEIKHGQRGLIQGCNFGPVITGRGVGGAACVQLKSTNQSGMTPWVKVADWTITGCDATGCSNFVWIANKDSEREVAESTSRVMVVGNIVRFSKTNTTEAPKCVHISAGRESGQPVRDVIVQYNSFRSEDGEGSLLYVDKSRDMPGDVACERLIWTNNTHTSTRYGLMGTERVTGAMIGDNMEG